MKNILVIICTVSLVLLSCKPSNKNLLISENGTSKYRIIYSSTAPDSLIQAVTAFKNSLKIITNVDIPAFADIVGKADQEILIGRSNRTASYDGSIPYVKLGSEGYYTMTQGQKWIVVGNTATAITNGLYDLINKLGCVKLTDNITQYSQHPSLAIKSDPGTVILPSFSYRQVINVHASNNEYRQWNRINIDNQNDWGTWAYSIEKIFPSTSYFSTHPSYFAQVGTSHSPDQVNFTDTSFINGLNKNLQVWTMSKGRAKYWSISPYSNHIVSDDPKTQAIIKSSGSPAGAVLTLVNELAAKNKEREYAVWLNGPYRKACTSIECAKNLMLVLDTKDVDHGVSLAEGNTNEAFRQDLTNWKKITSNIAVYMHVTNEENYLMPFPNLHALQKSLKYLHDQGVSKVIFTGESSVGSSFSDLKFYVASNLAWNVNQNVDTLIMRYCENTYGKAATYMNGYVQALERTIESGKSNLSMNASPSSAFRSWLTPAIINQLYTYFNSVVPLAQNNSEIKEKTDRDRLGLIYTQLEVAKSMGTKTFGFFMNVGALRQQLVKADQPVGKKEANIEMGSKKAEWRVIQGMKDLLTQFVNDCDRVGIKVIDDKGTTPARYQEITLKFLDQTVMTHLAFKAGSFSFNASPDPEYADGDPSTLHDGIGGIAECPKTNWLALKGGEGEVTWDYGRDTMISSVNLRFLQNLTARAWIPATVTCLVSTDGNKFTEVKKSTLSASKVTQIINQNFSFGKRSIRAIKIKTTSPSVCPADHERSGDPAVVLVDELTIR